MRRGIEVFFSFLLLVIISPLFLIISILIKTTSNGPVFFKQKRIGKNNIEFMLYKFRTMKVGSPNVATELLKNSDKYITRIGKILRKSSMDELPQLINIIKGEMSFIGPRPALYNQYELKKMRTENGVHKLLPGVTGWAQVNGRDQLSDYDKVMADKWYLHHNGIRTNVKILFMTFFKVLKAEGVMEGAKRREAEERSV